ncbi:MAG: hypothetical protein KY438_10655, partial [Actinobacteria bacterium]|nr:hypothetical protein [Actinomycetota bacterium]
MAVDLRRAWPGVAGFEHDARLAERHGLVGPALGHRQLALLNAFGLPTAAKPEWPVEDMIAVMRRDKTAAGGRMRFILPTRIGEVQLID